MDIKQRLALLFSIVEHLQPSNRCTLHLGANLDCINAEFRTKRGRIIGVMGVAEAMFALTEDVYVFETFDLREAYKVTLRGM